MLYLMHIPWAWIKQRPHFIAENLKEYFNITVLYPESFLKNKQLIKTDKNSYIKSFKTFPLQRFRYNRLFNYINFYFTLFQIRKYIKSTKLIWITDPFYYQIIKNIIQDTHIIVFDCMDDFMEFPQIKNNNKLAQIYLLAGKNIMSRANLIITSSHYLKEKLLSRYHLNTEISVINNALSDSFFNKEISRQKINYPEKSGFVDLLYIGTISDWFNFDLVIKSLKLFKNIRFILIGPAEIKIPQSEFIIHLGSVMHNELYNYMTKADALIMPFIITDLIKSVNPVKLYEYIYSGKPIITCNYSEIDQFDKFVYRYNTEEQFYNLIKKLINKDLLVQSEKDRKDFLLMNTWHERTNGIIKILHQIFPQ